MLRNVLLLLALVVFAAVMMDSVMQSVTETPPQGTQPASVRGEALAAKGSEAPRTESIDDRSFTVQPDPRGHHQVEAIVNNQTFTMLVDTGASKLFLSRSDAERLGIDIDSLKFSQRIVTANGSIPVAPLTLDRVEIGPIRVDNVSAAVLDSELTTSLLGMSFLNRLAGFEVRGGNLILRY